MTSLSATIRETKTRGEINSLRAKGFIPCIIYGGVEKNQKIYINKKIIKNLISFITCSFIKDYKKSY